MKIICQKNELAKYLPIATSIATPKTAVSALTTLLLRTDNDRQMSITATDLDRWLRCPIYVTVLEPGEITVDARLFNALIQSFIDEQITIESNDDGKSIVIQCGDSQYRLATFDSASFPEFPNVLYDGVHFRMGKTTFIEMLGNTLYAASRDSSSRQIITGILIESSNANFRMVATDTHRMAIADCRDVPVLPDSDMSFVIPAQFARDIVKIVGVVDAQLMDIYCAREQQHRNMVFWDFCGQLIYAARLLDGQFPRYERVIPTDFSVTAIYGKSALVSALKRIGLVADKTGKLILSIKSNSTHIRVDTETAQADERIGCLSNADTEEFNIAFCGQYLYEAIEPVNGDEVVIQFSSPESQALIHDGVGDKYRAIVMPMRM